MLLDFLQLNIPKGGNMRKADKTKLLLVIGISLIFSMAGCVDTSVQSIPSSVVYHSQLKFVNLVAGGGIATLTMNGQSLGTVDVGNELPSSASFMDVQAGNKTLNVSFANGPSKVFKFSADTDYKIRIFLAGTDSSNDLYKNAERYIWQTKGSENGKTLFPPDTGWISVFNGSPDAEVAGLTVSGGGLDTAITFGSALAIGSGAPYMKLKSSTAYNLYMISGSGDTLATISSFNPASQGKYTAVVYDSTNNLKTKVFTDD